MKFHLMVRSKGNILVKDKALTGEKLNQGEEESKNTSSSMTKLYTSKFPSQTETEYRQTRIMLSDKNQLRADMLREMEILETDLRVLTSS